VEGRQKRHIPVIIFPYINAVLAERSTANRAAAANAHPAVPRNTWKWEKSTPDRLCYSLKYASKLNTAKG
jgi:hypothetical protein